MGTALRSAQDTCGRSEECRKHIWAPGGCFAQFSALSTLEVHYVHSSAGYDRDALHSASSMEEADLLADGLGGAPQPLLKRLHVEICSLQVYSPCVTVLSTVKLARSRASHRG